MVDFTNADAARVTVPWLAMHGVHAVVGTTGFTDADIEAFRSEFSGSRRGGAWVLGRRRHLHRGWPARGPEPVLDSRKPTRHVLLFADAADSEEATEYRETLARLRREQVSVSVIAMGSPKDSDAKLLEEVARLGGAGIYFAEDASSLPAIFSQETMAVARATFVDTAAPFEAGPDLLQLGKLGAPAAPAVGGYNLTYLRPQASSSLTQRREPRADCCRCGRGAPAGWRVHRRGRRRVHRADAAVRRLSGAPRADGALDPGGAQRASSRRCRAPFARATTCT